MSNLLGRTFVDGERVCGKDKKSKFVRDTIHREIFKNFSLEKIGYKSIDFHDKLRIRHKIILNCTSPRTGSAGYFNVNHKYMLYYIHSHQKMNISSSLFHYLKDAIKTNRTNVIQSKKTENYIPIGRLLPDVFVESVLVDFLIKEAKYIKYIIPYIREPININTLKNMTMMKQFQISSPTPPSDIAERRIQVKNYPSFTKRDSLEEIVEYIAMMTGAGVYISCDRHEDPVIASGPLKNSKGKGKQTSEGPEYITKKKHDKGQASRNTPMATDSGKTASKGNSSIPFSSESLEKAVNELPFPTISILIFSTPSAFQTTILEIIVTNTSTFPTSIFELKLKTLPDSSTTSVSTPFDHIPL